MNILTILFLLEMGTGQNSVMLYNDQYGMLRDVDNDNYIVMSVDAVFYGHIKIYGSTKTNFIMDGIDGHPNTGTYQIGAAGILGPIEVGIKHECAHNIDTPVAPDIMYNAGSTYFYMTVTGEIIVF